MTQHKAIFDLFKVLGSDKDPAITLLIKDSIVHLRDKLRRSNIPYLQVDLHSKPFEELGTVYVNLLSKYITPQDDNDMYDCTIRVIQTHPLLEEGERMLLLSLIKGRNGRLEYLDDINPLTDTIRLVEALMVINCLQNIAYKFRDSDTLSEAIAFLRKYVHHNIKLQSKTAVATITAFKDVGRTLHKLVQLVPPVRAPIKLYVFASHREKDDRWNPLKKLDNLSKAHHSVLQSDLDPRAKNALNKLSYTYLPSGAADGLKDDQNRHKFVEKLVEQMTYTFTLGADYDSWKHFALPKNPICVLEIAVPTGVSLVPVLLRSGLQRFPVHIIPPGHTYKVVKFNPPCAYKVSMSADTKTMTLQSEIFNF